MTAVDPALGRSAAPRPVPSGSLPPGAALCMTTLALVIAAGIYLAAHLPAVASMAPAVLLIALGGTVLAVNLVLLARVPSFAWPVFFRVAGWAALAYGVVGGMLEFVFVYDHTRGSMLVAVTVSLVIFVVDIAVLLGFSVARYQPVIGPAEG